MKNVLSPIILLAALSPLCSVFAQTETGSRGQRGTEKTAPASAKKSGSDKPLKAQETAAANDPTGQSLTSDGTEKAVGADATRAANNNRSPEDKVADARKFYESGVASFESGKLDEAIGKLTQAVKLDPRNAQAQYSLGLAYSKSNLYKEAAESFKRAARFRPDWAEARFRLGWMYYVLDKRSSALDEYQKLLDLGSPLADTLSRIIKNESQSPEVAVAAADSQPSSKKDEPRREGSGSGSKSKKETAKTNNQSGSASDRVATATKENESSVSAVPSPAVTTNGNPTSDPTSSPATSVSATGSNATSVSSDEAALVNIYRVGIGDVLDIRLLNSATNRSTLYTVMDGGLIEFPLVGGSMAVAGLTTDEIQARLGAELKRRAVQENAPLTVGVRQYVSHTAIITGLVGIPGTKTLRRETVPLFVILAEAQPRLDAARATIMRGSGVGTTLDLGDAAALNFLVRPGDVITLTSRPQDFYYIAGRINNPGQKIFQPGITLLQAILAAGGPVRQQSSNAVDLSREGADSRLSTTRYNLKEIKSGKVRDPRLQPGDRIEVVR
jgi:protein involved in polysaccharide export with SLBB domain/Flp pilus assembly protein TadD